MNSLERASALERQDEVQHVNEAGVSIVIPAYNYARYLGTAIESALAQSHQRFEVVVVDDGSTDNTKEIVLSYGDPRIRYVWQRNQGLSAARNTGICEARFEFLTFLDADDVLLSNHLTDALDLFARLPREFAVVAAPSARIDECGNTVPTRRVAPKARSREIRATDLILKNRFPCTAVVRRSAFAACGDFDTSLRSSEDRDMWIRIAARYRIACLAHATVLVRRHSENMSKQADRMRLSMQTVIRLARERNIVPRHRIFFWLRAWAVFHFESSWMLHDEDRFAEATREAMKALVFWPLPLNANALGEPVFFRLRALRRFLSLIAGAKSRG